MNNRPVVVWWVKRDARLEDNACLTEANRIGAFVIPIFCFEPSLLGAEDSSAMHLNAQFQALSDLRCRLRKLGGDLIIAHGEVVLKLTKLYAIFPFRYLFSHEEIGNNLTFSRDRAVAVWCQAYGVQYQEFPQSSVRRGGVNRDRRQIIWEKRIVEQLPLPVPIINFPDGIRKLIASTDFPKLSEFASNPQWQRVSETDAQSTLADFLTRRGQWYRGGISSPNTALTAGSRLSVHLAWGTITSRQIWHAVQQRLMELDPEDPTLSRWKLSLEAFISRLHWRDHFTQRLETEPDLEFRSIHPKFRGIPYENNKDLYEAWREGRTGYLLVDAVMRCLVETGFVNFRMRAMVVSFACHVLHLDWRLIHPHLARVFRDYDPGIHLNQLQMQAGVVGWNAIRVYNPKKQLFDWDRKCRFVKQWVPEVRPLVAERILNEEKLPNYLLPVVPFRPRVKQMTDILYAIRKNAEFKSITQEVYQRHGSRKKETSLRSKKANKAKDPQQPTLFDLGPTD